MQKRDRTWYEAHGVENPKHEPHLTEDRLEEIFDKMRAPNVHGNWKQKGNILECHKCPNVHATEPIDPNYLLTGTDSKGLPMLRKLS